jgi:GNAT superfamily N-acetyltransferase
MTIALAFASATEADVGAIAVLRTAVAHRLTRDYGTGHWSSPVSENAVFRGMHGARVLIARSKREIVATLRLARKKPWAIDASYFTDVPFPLYLTDMAVLPELQGKGVGRRLLGEAATIAREWPSDALRLDAYDADAGAGPFYAKCGYREVGRAVYRKTPLIYFELLL